jgi:glucose/arabinose dehydrogenase
VRGSTRRAAFHAVAATAAAVALAGCASFPDTGQRDWQPKIEGTGELGGPPRLADPDAPTTQPGGPAPSASQAPTAPTGCSDPDPQVVATCLGPVGAVAALPDGATALVGERTTGRVLRVRRGDPPALVTTIPVDATGGGGLTGLVLSPGYAEDQLVYAYVTTATDNRVVKIPPGEPAKPVLTGIPRGPVHNGGALAAGTDGSLLVATGDAGAPGSGLAGTVLRIDTLGNPAVGDPRADSPVYATGVTDPGGLCVDAQTDAIWLTDRTADGDVLRRVAGGPLPAPAWRWPERPGVGGCAAQDGAIQVAENAGAALATLQADESGQFTGTPQQLLANAYGRLAAAAAGPDGYTWLGTVNRAGGKPVSSDDRVIRIRAGGGGGTSRA